MARLDLRTALLLTLPPALWAGNAVVGRLAVGSVSPVLLNTLRWVLAALILLPLGWRVLREREALRGFGGRFLMLGLLGVGAYNTLQYLALHTSTPINVTLIGASMPLWMLLTGALFFGERPRAWQMLGAVLSLGGVLLVLSRGSVETLLQLRPVPGDLLMLAATIAWSFYSWMLSRPGASPERQWTWSQFLLVQVLAGLMWAVPASVVEGLAGPLTLQWNGWVVVLLLYVSIGPAVLAYRCWGLGVARVGPALAGFFVNLTPLFAAVLSAALLGELPHLYHGAAFALIVAGIVVSSRR